MSGDPLDGDVIVEFPQPPHQTYDWTGIRVYDAATSQARLAVTELHIYADAEGLAMVETVELTDQTGTPLDGGNSVVPLVDGQMPQRKFRYALAGVRIRA